MTTQDHEPIFACHLDAIPASHWAEHEALVRRLFASALSGHALPLGYAWQLPNEIETFQSVSAFISYERLCCPFFHFVLDVEPDQGAVWLQITGTRDIKPFALSVGWFSSEEPPLFVE